MFFSLLFSFGKDIDMYGHLGGMIGGFMMALAVLPSISNNSNKIFKLIGALGAGTYLITTFVLFYFLII